MEALTFSKCKNGLDNIFLYFNKNVCSKLFINDDHIKIISYDGFKLPVKKINSFLKDLGYIIYVEVVNGNSSNKMFRFVDQTTNYSFNDLKLKVPNIITCCLNSKGLKIPGHFKMSEIVTIITDFCEDFNKPEIIPFIEVQQDFPKLPSTNNTVSEVISTEVIATEVIATEVIAPEVIAPEVQKIVINETPKNSENSENSEYINTPSERKLLKAECEIRIAQLKHNIAYLEVCLQNELSYFETL